MRKLTYSTSLVAAIALVLAVAGCTARTKAIYHLKRADQLFDSGQYPSAEIEYENVLRNDPKNARAWDRLGDLYFNEGRGAETIPVLQRAEQIDPGNLDARLKLGDLYLELGQSRQACQEADFVLSRNPMDEQAPLLLARAAATNEINAVRLQIQNLQSKGSRSSLETALGILALRQHDLKTAAIRFKKAISLDASFSDAYGSLGALQFAQKDWKQADHDFHAAADLAPVWSGNGVRYAQFEILTGDSVGAENFLHKIVATAPFYFPAWMTLAQISVSQNDYSNALAFVCNVLNRDPRNFAAWLFQGRIELLQREPALAQQNYQQMTRIYPDAPSVLYALAQACLANNQTNEADVALNKALAIKPDFPDAILLRAETQIAHGNPALAIVTLKQLVRNQPRFIRAWLLLAEAYRAQGATDNAVEIYRNLEASAPDNAQVPVLLGDLLYYQKQTSAARAEFQKALHIQPEYAPAVEHLVDLELDQKQYAAALQRVQQLVVRDPQRAISQFLLGATLAADGQTNRAELALLKAINLQPDSQAAYLILAQLYVQAGQNQKALKQLQLALNREPNDLAAVMLKGIICNSQGDYEDARNAYEKVLTIAPDNGMALNNLACIYADHLNQLDKAYPLARRAREIVPSDPSVADTLGWILYRRGEYTPALVLLRESAAKLYSDPEIQFHLGMACYTDGLDSDAKGAFQRALTLDKNFPEEDRCRMHLAIIEIDPGRTTSDTFAWLEKWIAAHPGDAVALGRLACIYQSKGMINKAIATDQAILNVNANNIFALTNLAGLYALTDPQKAISFAKSAYDLAPANWEITHLYGRLAFKVGNYSWALTLLQLCSQARPDDPDILFDLGRAFYSMGRVSEAEALVQRALQLGGAFTRTGDAKRFLAMTALANDASSASAGRISKILNVTPNYVPALMIEAAICARESETATARQTYRRVLSIYPDFVPAMRDLAVLDADDPSADAEGYPIAVQARQALPHDPAVAKALGMIVCRQGDYTRAAALLKESLFQSHNDSQLLYYLGLADFHLKDVPDSRANLQRALSLNLSGHDATDARRMLAELK